MATRSPAKLTRRERSQKANAQFKDTRIKAVALSETASASGFRNDHKNVQNVPWMLKHNRDQIERKQTECASERIDYTNPTERAQYSEMLKESYVNPEVAAEVAAYREFELTNEVYALPFALSAFAETPLGDNEMPALTTSQQRKYFTARYQGQGSGFMQEQLQTGRTFEVREMRQMASSKVEYPLMDIQIGAVDTFPKLQSELRFDLEMQIDELAKVNIDNAKTVAGLRDLLHLHPLIIAANLPDTNYLNLSGGADDGIITLEKYKLILAHFNGFSVGVDPTGSLMPQTMHISPLSIRDHWDYTDLVSGFDSTSTLGINAANPKKVVPTSVRDAIFAGGSMSSAWGYSWTTLPNARLARGRLYVTTNQPLGWYFTKPSMDKVINWNGPDQILDNRGFTAITKVLQFVIPDLWLHRILIVDY